ncbi:hypothetical protein B0H19DRAFT_915644, partial [Mycena capillaripes]
PLYAALLVSSKGRRKFSVERLFHVSTLSGGGVGCIGGLATYSRNALSDAATLKQLRVELAYNVIFPIILASKLTRLNNGHKASRRREDDFGTIGVVLGACLAPAVFWTRAGLLD